MKLVEMLVRSVDFYKEFEKFPSTNTDLVALLSAWPDQLPCGYLF